LEGLIQRDAMRAVLDVGDAAMHRAFKPTEKELKVALMLLKVFFLQYLDTRTRLKSLLIVSLLVHQDLKELNESRKYQK